MEANYIKELLNKYFEAETTLEEEKILKEYFLSENVSEDLAVYKNLFVGYAQAQTEPFTKELEFPKFKVHKNQKWYAIAATVVVLFGTVVLLQPPEKQAKTSNELGTFTDPEVAFIETQKALTMVSKNINIGIENANYVTEFKKSKEKVFKKTTLKNNK
jgi:hypothetical protein